MSIKDDNEALREAIAQGDHHSIFYMEGETRAATKLTTAQFIDAYDAWNANFIGIRRQRADHPRPPAPNIF